MVFSVTDYGAYQIEYSITFDHIEISIVAENYSGSCKVRILNGCFLRWRLKRARKDIYKKYQHFNHKVKMYAVIINQVEGLSLEA